MPHYQFIQTRGARKVKAAKAPIIGVVASLKATRRSFPGLGLRCLTVRLRRHKVGNRARAEVGGRMVELLPRLRRFAHSLTHDWDLSEDLVQETCARALAHLDQWQPDTRLDSWMYRIAQNLWIDQLRAEKVRGEPVDIAAVRNLSDCDGRVVTESRLSLLELKECIAALPLEQRVLLNLVCVDGLSYKEAAEAIDSPTGTVMSRLARARLALHDAMARRPARSRDEFELAQDEKQPTQR
jgi:RNA polymerase sigma-70 factor, ECF subfamily